MQNQYFISVYDFEPPNLSPNRGGSYLLSEGPQTSPQPALNFERFRSAVTKFR